MALPPTFRARLVSRQPLTKNVAHFLFERADGAPMTFEAGQWVNLIMEGAAADGSALRRAYSIASPPRAEPTFELAITRVEGGPGTAFLFALEPGQELEVVGPQGFFTRPLGSASPSLLVGTGTGLTPLRSMLLSAKAHGSLVPATLLFGVREESDILFRRELEALSESDSPLRAHFTLSRADDAWTGRRGWVQTHVLELYDALKGGSETPPHVYICGLRPMVDAVRELLKTELGLPRQLVHSERYD
ncbi:MAG: FAD-dependent oxidoreductase [Myxococcales bacterium]|nr:FAD-dependent oxidoreductase [Myxococcales bacterium]